MPSLLILFPSSHFYLVFHLTTQLKQPPVFFLFLQSIRNKWGDIFFLPLIQIKIELLYGVASKCYWQNFRVYGEIWGLKSTCEVKMDRVQNYRWKLITLLPYSVPCHLFPPGPEQPVWQDAYCWGLDEIVLTCIDAMEMGVSILHGVLLWRSPRWVMN